MKTKTMTLVPVMIILVAAIAVSLLVTRQAVWQQAKAQPVFWGEEITVTKTVVKAVPQVKPMTKVVAKSVPVPQPKVAVPLPIMPPKVVFRVLPQYPAAALAQGLQGTVLLSMSVGLTGQAGQVMVKSSSGAAELDQAALAAVSQWQFSPATQGNAAITSRFEVPVRFEVK